jgi:hypothetical protein
MFVLPHGWEHGGSLRNKCLYMQYLEPEDDGAEVDETVRSVSPADGTIAGAGDCELQPDSSMTFLTWLRRGTFAIHASRIILLGICRSCAVLSPRNETTQTEARAVKPDGGCVSQDKEARRAQVDAPVHDLPFVLILTT